MHASLPRKKIPYETLLILYTVPGCLLVHLLESWWEGVVKNMTDHNIRVVPKLFQALLNKAQTPEIIEGTHHPYLHDLIPRP